MPDVVAVIAVGPDGTVAFSSRGRLGVPERLEPGERLRVYADGEVVRTLATPADVVEAHPHLAAVDAAETRAAFASLRDDDHA